MAKSEQERNIITNNKILGRSHEDMFSGSEE
jgi:hypothetical protein